MTNYNTRASVTPSSYTWRIWTQSDLWHLLTQLWILCNNSWVRILFHTWTFYDSPTQYTWRIIPN